MTSINKKSAAVKFDANRHYPIDSKPLRGRSWEIKKNPNTGEIVLLDGMPVKVYFDVSVSATPEVDNEHLFLSRLRSNHNIGEWVTK